MKGAKEFKEAMKNGLAEEFKSFAAGRKPKDEKAAAALVVEFAKLHGYDVGASAADASRNGHILCDDQLSMAAGGRNAGDITGANGKGLEVAFVFQAGERNDASVIMASEKKDANLCIASEKKDSNFLL